MRKLILVGILLVSLVGIGVAGAQSPEGDEPYSYTKSSTREGFFRFDLPVGEYACRFFTSYDGSLNVPGSYMKAYAYMLDEESGSYEEFASVGDLDHDIKHVMVQRSVGTSTEDEANRLARQLFGNLFAWGDRATIRDQTPRMEISLSRAFRSNDLRWTFQCVEFAWPE